MGKATNIAIAGVVAVVAIWAGGIWCSGHYAEQVVGKALDELNSNLERRHSSGSLNFGIKTAYEVTEKGFFSQKGNILITPEGLDHAYRVPLEIEHGFLRLKGQADLFHFLNNLFLKNGILERDSAQAQAYADFRLFPMNYNLKVKLDGKYAQSFLNTGSKHKYDVVEQKYVHGVFNMHRSTFGTISTDISAQNLFTPYGTLGSVFVRDVFEEKAQGLGNLHAELMDMNLRGTAFDELYSLKADINSLTAKMPENFGVKIKLDAKTTKGSGYAVLSAGDFSLKALDESGGSIIEALTTPLLLTQYLAQGKAWLNLEDLQFNVDFTGADGRVAYDIGGQGQLTYPAQDMSLSSVNGKFSFSFEHVNEGGEQIIDMLGRNIFVKNSAGYLTDIVIENGRLSFNGK